MSHRFKSVTSAVSVAAVALAFSVGARRTQAAAFTAGDIVVTRVGTGGIVTLGNSATTAFLDEYNPVTLAANPGAIVQTIALPDAITGNSNAMLTLTGNSASEGFLKLSPDKTTLAIAGYNASNGASTPAASATNRVVGLIDATGTVDTTTVMGYTLTSNSNARSAIVDGTKVYLSTSTDGVEILTRDQTTARSTSTTRLSSSATNTRAVDIVGGQLYISAASAPIEGVATLGSGEPTTTGQSATELPGFPTTATNNPSPYDFLFADATDLYVADDRTNGLGGISKWTFNGTTWSVAYVLAPDASTGFRSLTGVSTAQGFQLYAISDTASSTGLYSILDATPLTGAVTYTNLISLPGTTNEALRGVSFVPVAAPEPASLGLLTVGGLLLLRRRR